MRKTAGKQRRRAKTLRNRLLPTLLLAAVVALPAQGPASNNMGQPPHTAPPTAAQEPSTEPVARVAIHGTVLNAASGEPIARALVSVEGDASLVELTDGEGHFEFDGITAGEHVLSARKPGYRGGDNLDGDVVADLPGAEGINSSVLVTDQTPEVVFKLTPNSAIRGHVDLSTGDPAAGILLQLIERRVVNGRGSWTTVDTGKTNSSGNYRFSGLAAGTYLVKTMPSMEAESVGVAAPSANAPLLVQYGFASVYYPEARDFASAGRIEVRAGEEMQANFQLHIEPFQPVLARLPKEPGAARQQPPQRGGKVELASVTDESGNTADYPLDFNTEKRTLLTHLPDGVYNLNLISFSGSGLFNLDQMNEIRMGTVGFSVSGHPVTDLSLAPGPAPPIRVHVNLPQSTKQQASAGSKSSLPVYVTFTHADGPAQELAATGAPVQDTITFLPGGTGRYWASATIDRAGVCVSAFTAGGADLAREPLLLNPSIPTPTLEVTLRDDCAKLNLSLPSGAAMVRPGSQATYTVYAVPDFETTATVTPSTMRPGSGATVTLESLTPGSYHIYVFNEPVSLEYHNPAALQNLSGQQVTLAPTSSADLVLEVPQP